MSTLNMNAESYRTHTRTKKPVLAEFSAPWCICRRLAPALEAVAEEYQDTPVFGAINIDGEPELARSEEIEVVPTLLLYQNGQVVGSVAAPESKAQLVSFMELPHSGKLTGIRMRNVKTGEESTLACDGVFGKERGGKCNM